MTHNPFSATFDFVDEDMQVPIPLNQQMTIHGDMIIEGGVIAEGNLIIET